MNPALEIFQKYVQPLGLSIILLVAAWFVSPYRSLIADSFVGLWDYGPYVMVTVLAGFGVAYNRGRALLVSLLLALALFISDYGQWLATWSEPVFSGFILAGLIPFNIALIGWYKERGVFTFYGMVRLGIVLGQILTLGAFYYFAPEAFVTVIDGIQISFIEPDAATPLPYAHLSYLLMLLSGLSLLVAAYMQRTTLSFGLFATLCGISLALIFTERAELFHINIVAICLILCISILRDSYHMAYMDELTGLPQRRALNEQFMSLGGQYALAMLDIDHFKKFNDTHGHDVGDQVLRMVAAQIAKVRDGGKAYRYGGEEFSVVYTSKVKEQTIRSLEEVRESIESYEMVIRAPRPEDKDKKSNENKKKENASKAKRGKGSSSGAKTVSVTISIGVADKVERYEAPDDVLKNADKALYQAKKKGRNQVVIWEEKKTKPKKKEPA